MLAFAASFVLLALSPRGHIAEVQVPYGGESVRVARSLATTGTFANPFAVLRTGPTAHIAPVYPFLYSLFLRAFGTGYTALSLLWVWNLSLLALQIALLPYLTSRLGLGPRPGLIVAALGSISLHTDIDTRWECFLCGALLLLAYLLLENTDLWRRPSGAALVGLLWGVLILTNPVTLLLFVAWHGVKIFARPHSEQAVLIRAFALMAAAAMLTVAPWIARNYARLGAPVFVRDNFGLELYTGNNPCAQPTLQQEINSGCHARTHPNPTAAIAAQLAAEGEVAFNRARLHDALAWIGANRSAFLALTARRFRQFWLPDLDHRWQEIPVWTVTLLAMIGLGVLAKRNRAAAWLIATTWLLFPAIYYVVPAEPRYRYPVYWTMLLAAGCAIAELHRSSSKSEFQR